MRNGVYPTIRALLALSLPLPVFGFSFFWEPLLYIGAGMDVFILFVILFDALVSPNYKKNLVIEIRFPQTFTINTSNRFTLIAGNLNRLPVRFRILLDFDTSFDRLYSKTTLSVGPSETREFSLSIFARRRGSFHSATLYLKGRSLFGFLSFYRKKDSSCSVKVPPFIDPVNQVFKVTQKKIKQSEGMQKSAILGRGRDFEMLRDYIKGDDFNTIDWKATARIRKPVTRVFRLENSMHLAMLIDCGRIMATEVQGMSLLDYACNASLILAYSAIKNYDSASLLCFGSSISNYIPPVKNKKDIHKFNLVLSHAEFEHVEPNYSEALAFISQKLAKRSIILLFTDIIDDSNIKILNRFLAVMRKKHIVILILIRDKNLFRTGQATVNEGISIHTKAAAADLILRRTKTIHNLRRLGIDILDVYPEEVSARLVSRYLELKSRN